MAQRYLTEDELLQHIAHWQEILGQVAQKIGALRAKSTMLLRKGGTAGSGETLLTLTHLNTQIQVEAVNAAIALQGLLGDLFFTCGVTASGSISSGDQLDVNSVTVGVALAPLYGVSDSSDIPYAWWGEDTDYFLGQEVDSAVDAVSMLGLAADDVVLVQDSNAITNSGGAAGTQRGRRLRVKAVATSDTHRGTTYHGVIEFSTDVEDPYPLRDKDALEDPTKNYRAKDTRLILRKVYDDV